MVKSVQIAEQDGGEKKKEKYDPLICDTSSQSKCQSQSKDKV